ncbi:hypothetical protein HNV11_19875 [Spirosoma taeanense]|uniref:DUF4136 domain-containing protein n=1 Tax=Spirosoma taeanense TaxID=2735870 RepID=A0A6M5YDT2_9BACT|nr:hypothetical protein [Spirosoma taeanense]QJW91476.1 hypothetical protein HNV11_19875 [Spirosoma taeanense]
MKALVTLLLLLTGFGAVAQRSSRKEVTTDGRQLRIRVDIEQPGRSVHYNRSFDVADMEESAVKALENRILDSLDQSLTDNRSAVSVGKKRAVWTKQTDCDEQVAYSTVSESRSEQFEAHASSSLSPGDVAPSSVIHREDKENGRLWMQYTFQKDGEELVIERTANVIGKTEREKQAIIRETERSFGIKTANQ